VARRSEREIRETLDEMRRAHDQLETQPSRRKEAEQHLRLLEHLLLHGETHKGNPNLTANAIVRRARGFLLEWNDAGFMYDAG
jgi:hypothetical protein